MDLPQYAEVHVVSDLHMGGEGSGFQIFRETKRLAEFVRWVARRRPDSPVALVLNGDVVDTLAENVGGYIAIDNAISVLERIMGDTSFSPIWKALAAFVATPNRTLVFVLGNHDVELAFPLVQRRIVLELAGQSLEARARIEFATVGAGYSCMVGPARVFCTHGNEVDPWNYVQYEDVSRAARRVNSGRTLTAAEWEPNAGTKLVKDVMNEVKRRYAWIDLLKPETQAAIGVLLVLDPGQAAKVARLPPVIGRLVRGIAQYEGRLGANGTAASGPTTSGIPDVARLLGPNASQGLRSGPARAGGAVDDLLLAAETNFAKPRRDDPSTDETLGTAQLLWDRLTGWIRREGKDEALRKALLDWLSNDKTFDVAEQDDTFQHVTSSIGAGIDFVVTGHTHLERAIEMGANRFYFNCGTWIRLLRFTEAMLKDTESFKPVFNVLENGAMAAIDPAVFGSSPFVLDRTSAVCIKTDDRGVTGTLAHVTGGPEMVQVVQEFVRR